MDRSSLVDTTSYAANTDKDDVANLNDSKEQNDNQMIWVVVVVLSIALMCSLCAIAYLMQRSKASKRVNEKDIKVHEQLQVVGQQPGAADGDAGDADDVGIDEGIEGDNVIMKIERVIDDDEDVIELVNKTADIMNDGDDSLIQEINETQMGDEFIINDSEDDEEFATPIG